MPTNIPYVASGETPHEPVTSQGVIEARAWDHWAESRALIMEAPLPEAAKQRLIDSLGPEPPMDAKIQIDYDGDQVLEPSSQLAPSETLPPDREPELAADDGMEIIEDEPPPLDPIKTVEMGEWVMSGDGTTETRMHIGQNEEGRYHYGMETSYLGDEGRGHGWSVETFETKEAARNAGWEHEIEDGIDLSDDDDIYPF